MFRPSTSCFVCGQGVDTRHALGMTAECGVTTERHVIHGFNCQTATVLQTCVIAPVVCGAGAPSSLAFPPSCERACGTPGARCTLGPDAMRSSAIWNASGLSDALGEVPGVPPAVFFRLACTLPQRTIRSPKLWSHGGGTGSLKRESRTRFDLVVRHTVQGSFHLKVGRLLASGSAGADPSCPKTDVPREPRNAASPASTASHPANVTIAIAPLGGAGRRRI
jgi:hypothetical protein